MKAQNLLLLTGLTSVVCITLGFIFSLSGNVALTVWFSGSALLMGNFTTGIVLINK